MAEQWQLRKGSTAENNGFVGAEGELTYDTTTKAVHVHDGETAGGALIDTVVAFQLPTSSNSYTWYRKYASGWVEQGGIWTGSISAASGSDGHITINLPVTMTDTNYCVNITNNSGTGTTTVWEMWNVESLTTNQFGIHMGAYANTRTITRMNWEVKGMAA